MNVYSLEKIRLFSIVIEGKIFEGANEVDMPKPEKESSIYRATDIHIP